MRKTFLSALVALATILPAAALAQGLVTKPISEKFTAEDWVKNTSYATVGVRAVNASNVYQVITAGTSEDADNAGPKTTSTGFPTDITDGTVHWKWLGTTTALGIDNTSTAGEAALASSVIDTKALESVIIIAKAVGTSSDRVLTVSCMAQNGTTALYSFPTVSVAANASAMVVIRANPKQSPAYERAWPASTAVTLGQHVTNSGNLYEVITAGTTAASGGPTTTAADITDNTAHWKYLGVAGAAAPTGVTVWNVTPCPRLKASLAAISAGSGITADLAVYGRKLSIPDSTLAPAGVNWVDYESGSVASGAAISKTINAASLRSVQILTEATTTSRALVVSCMTQDGVNTLFSFPSFTVTQGQKYLLTYRFDSSSPAAEPTNLLHVPVDICPVMKFSIAATGSASAKLAVYGR